VDGRCFSVEQHYLKDIQKLVAIQQFEVAKDRGKNYQEKNERGDKAWKGKDKLSLPNQLNMPELPPKFDAEIIAETVIRIIQTYSKRNRAAAFSQPPGLAQPSSASLSKSNTNPTSSGSVEGTGDAILVFLSGIQAITKVSRALRQRDMTSLNAQVQLLHGSLQPEVQRRAFKKTKPGEWKIVLSTNIAETSVTVEDVTHVLDCGLVKVRVL
jgi:HrpA-like RNA helicase